MKDFKIQNLIQENNLDIPKEFLFQLWKRKKPSENYHRSYYATFPDGAICTIEYNFLREVVKIEFHFPEDSRDYSIMIQRGSILKEREIQSNRPVSLYNRIQKYKKFFSYLIDEQVLKTIGGSYGIPEKSLHPNATSNFSILQLRKKIFYKPKRFLNRIKEYLKHKEIYQQNLKGFDRFTNRILGDLFDIIIVLFFYYLFLIGKISSFGFSFFCFFFSIFTGFLDIIVRRRKPLLFKSFLFFWLGGFIFWFQYQLYEWNIYEPIDINQKLWFMYLIFKHKTDLILNFF